MSGNLQSISQSVGDMVAGQSDTRGSSQKKADDANTSLGQFANPNSEYHITPQTNVIEHEADISL